MVFSKKSAEPSYGVKPIDSLDNFDTSTLSEGKWDWQPTEADILEDYSRDFWTNSEDPQQIPSTISSRIDRKPGRRQQWLTIRRAKRKKDFLSPRIIYASGIYDWQHEGALRLNASQPLVSTNW